jgi:transcriptional regulator with AAA-type ATPase domain
MARLLFHRGPVAPGDPPIFAARLRQTRTRIGRVDDCDVVLPDDGVSRSHCIIDQNGGAFELIDRSSNGTFRNGERVAQRCRLAQGDQLRIGPFTAVVDLTDESIAAPTEEPQPESRHEEIVEAGAQLAFAEATLIVTSGPGEGRRYRLRGSRITVGGPGSRVVIPDPSLTKEHARVRLNGGRTMIEPGLGAAFLGPARIRDILPVLPGEEVRIGDTTFTVDWEERQEVPTSERFGELVAASDAMRHAFGMLRRMAAHHAPVLLIGESGTGKELAARGVHDASPRAGTAFVALNCGAITGSLFEAELFGYEKGAFTGANERRDGAFHRAHGGTLFLDEVGELPEEAQTKLLRALESGEVRRVGGTEATYPDVRVVAATNRNLLDAVREGTFRSDLYFRLAVLAVRLPALRERPEDIPVIAEAVARRLHPDVRISAEAHQALRTYGWPGNARELRNVLTRAFVLSGPRIEPRSLLFNPLEGLPTVSPGARNDRNIIEDAEHEVVRDALRRANGNRTQAAKILGIARSTLLYKLRRWGEE